MTRRIYLYFIITFILGIIAGGAGAYYFLWYNGRLQRRERFNPHHAVARLKRVLNLTDTQAQQVEQIFDEGSKKISDLQKEIEPQFQAIHEDTRARIRKILNPDQVKKFDELLKRMDERRRRRGPPPG